MPTLRDIQDPLTYKRGFAALLDPVWPVPDWMWSLLTLLCAALIIAAPRLRLLNRPDWPLLSPWIRATFGLPLHWLGLLLCYAIGFWVFVVCALAYLGGFVEPAFRILESRLYAGLAGIGLGALFGLLARFWAIPAFERQAPPADVLGDAPIRSRDFDPAAYFKPKQGIFFGLDAAARPIYLPIRQARQHLQVVGRTGCGKGVSIQMLVPQFVQQGESAFLFDPKDDKFLPEVLAAWCASAGVPFRLIDLRSTVPQINLLAGISARDLSTLFSAGFGLADSGGIDRVYRLDDRKAAQTAAELIAGLPNPSLPELLGAAVTEESVTSAKVFWGFLQELAMLPAFATRDGLALSQCLAEPGITYVVGSTLDPVVIMAQKMLLLRVLQLIYARPRRDDQRWVTLVVDEFKYLLSQSAIDALGIVRDFNCHVVVAHQSLGDLEACPGIPPAMVAGAVRDNTGLKLTYRPVDDLTARWAQDLSGTTRKHIESVRKDVKEGTADGAWRDEEVPLVHRNDLYKLPDMSGVLFGVGAPTYVSMRPLRCRRARPTVTPAPPIPGAEDAAAPLASVRDLI